MEERVKMLQDAGVPYFGVCTNDTKVILDPKKIYGYYRRDIMVENPVTNITGANSIWMKHGDMCTLKIKFSGTPPFHTCEKITQNDNSTKSLHKVECDEKDWKQTDEKQIDYAHFFPKDSNSYTLTIFIKNEVSIKETPIGVQFYEGEDCWSF